MVCAYCINAQNTGSSWRSPVDTKESERGEEAKLDRKQVSFELQAQLKRKTRAGVLNNK